MSKKKINTHYVCPHCGSDDIDAEAWVSINNERVGNFTEGGDNFCNNCDENFKYWCEVNTSTGKCLDKHHEHDADFKPLENMTPPPTEVELINEARVMLAGVLERLKKAGAVKSMQRVRLARSSVKGALENARYRESAKASGRKRNRIKRAPTVAVRNVVKWNGLCPAGQHGLDYQGQFCGLCMNNKVSE